VETLLWWVVATVSGVAAALFHVWAASSATIPVLWTDELGYLANARILAGESALDLAGRSYYIGWSLLITPFWLISDNPVTVYQAAVWLSALLGVMVIPAVATLAVQLGAARAQGFAIGAVISLAPSRALFANFALAENMVTLLVALTAIAALKFHACRTTFWAAILAGTAAFLFLSHGRTVPIAAATALWFGWSAVRGSRAPAIVGLLVLAAISLSGFWLYRTVGGQLYPPGSDREASAIDRMVQADWTAVAISATGQVWYEYAVWLGFALLGALAVLAAMWREISSRRLGVATWATLGLSGVLFVSATWVSRTIAAGRDRLDIYSYGRYLEPYGATLAAMGLLLLVMGLNVRQRTIYAAGALVLSLVFLAVNAQRAPLGGALFWGPTSIPGLLQWDWPHVTPATSPPWLIASAAAAMGVIVTLTLHRWPVLVVALFAVYMAASSLVAQQKSILPYFTGFRESFGLRSELADVPAGQLSFDVWRPTGPGVPRDPVSRNAYQYWSMPGPTLLFSSEDSPPPTRYVISRREWPMGESLGAVKIGEDTGLFDNALWLVPASGLTDDTTD
jgi:hypothetical protein